MAEDILDASGLTLKSLNDLIDDLETGLKEIYGDDISVDQNSPDGQIINIFAQAARDVREILLSSYNSLDPDLASGVVLDQRVAINNIERKGGTYTVQPIDITVDRTTSLIGLDDDYNDPDATGYTVQDDAGNQFILADSIVLTAGTTSCNFRAKDIGQVETTIGTITNQVTIVLGVTAVNNSSAALEVGEDEETDAQLKVRRSYSIANNSKAYIDGLRGSLLDLDGVTEARVYENYTGEEDADGIPEHCIWVIVEGGANTDIADTIYAKKTPGTNMKGSVEVEIDTDSGDVFTAKFDRPSAKNLHIRFDIQTTVSGTSFDEDSIKAYIVENLIYNIGDYAETSAITTMARAAIDSLGGGGVPVNVEISANDADWYDFLEVDTLNEQWTLDAANIDITVIT